MIVTEQRIIDLVSRGPSRILLKIFLFREAVTSMKRNEPVIRVFVIRLVLIFRRYFLSDGPLNTTHRVLCLRLIFGNITQ